MHYAGRIGSVRLCAGSASAERVEQGGGGWGHLQGAVHMAAARLNWL